jgi:hypothetical protein
MIIDFVIITAFVYYLSSCAHNHLIALLVEFSKCRSCESSSDSNDDESSKIDIYVHNPFILYIEMRYWLNNARLLDCYGL